MNPTESHLAFFIRHLLMVVAIIFSIALAFASESIPQELYRPMGIWGILFALVYGWMTPQSSETDDDKDTSPNPQSTHPVVIHHTTSHYQTMSGEYQKAPFGGVSHQVDVIHADGKVTHRYYETHGGDKVTVYTQGEPITPQGGD